MLLTSRHRAAAVTIGILAVFAASLSAGTTKPEVKETPSKQPPLAEVVRGRIKTVLDKLEADDNFDQAAGELRALFGQVVAYAAFEKSEPFVDSAVALRLVRQLGATPAGKQRVELLKFLRANDKLARALAFAVKPGLEKPEAVYALLERLRTTHGNKLNDYAYLATAICIVHNQPLARHINENRVAAPDPMAIFKYFAAHEKLMLFGIRNVPPELLMYVVDTTASIKEMMWALGRYKRDAKIGRHFFDVKYDFSHLRRGTPKKVTRAGYNLPNILKYGGICADQAYFAAAIGKAIGVPTCYAVGRGGDVGHAWVGFFQARKGQGRWNFDYGRYSDYLVVRGVLLDPQTRRMIPDDHLSVQAELIGAKAADRYAAIAFVDAARLLGDPGDAVEAPETLPAAGGEKVEPRKADVATQLALIEQGLRRAPGYAPGWLLASKLARSEGMTLEQKKYWTDNLQKMCGRKYPDFSMAVIKPMVETVEDIEEQNRLWNSCFRFFSGRKDLAAEIRMAQAAMWEEAGQPAKAGKCYEDVIKRFVNAGPFAIAALEKTEEKLRDLKREKLIPALYAGAWAKCRKPGKMTPDRMRRSNWTRIGILYARALADAGLKKKAVQVQARLEKVVGKLDI